jgi:four helix bundle protein
MKVERARFKEEFKQRVYDFALRLVRFVDQLPRGRVSRILGDQLLRSGTSIGANYAEARASASKKDFINFFSHSLKSANETKFWIALMRDSGKADRSEADSLLEEVNEISKILATSILTLKGRR